MAQVRAFCRYYENVREVLLTALITSLLDHNKTDRVGGEEEVYPVPAPTLGIHAAGVVADNRLEN